MLFPDLIKAYYDARRNKRNTRTQLEFELNLEQNLVALYEELRDRMYRPSSSICFVIEDPVKREVFASQFRDRVVHHLYYNYVSPIFEREFIYDSYSCRKGKGTLFGIQRLEHHIRSCTNNFTRNAYILKLDLSGYFMSINRALLHDVVISTLDKYWQRPAYKGKTWQQLLNVDFILYLTEVIIMKNPLEGCRIKGRLSDWDDLPHNKCLRYSPEGVGLPIGDLTSQLFSNVFLNKLDWYIQKTLGFRHYGRYVDDFFIIDTDRHRLKNAISPIASFLSGMGLTLHPHKIILQDCRKSISFLGAVLKPYQRYITPRTMRKFASKVDTFEEVCATLPSSEELTEIFTSLNSYFGYFQHFAMAKKENEKIKQGVLQHTFGMCVS